MKKTRKYILLGMCCLGLSLASCASDWLKTEPTQSASDDEILANTDNAKQAINGICKLMSMQHESYRQGFNGEGTIMLMYGEYLGEDFQFPKYAPGWATFMNGEDAILQNKNSIYPTYPWYYYYALIGNANTILEKADGMQGSIEEVKFIKAEALTFRAYAYSMLLQLYADRWADSNNGKANGVILRLDTSTDGLPLSSQDKCYKQIYEDLDKAITLFTESGLTRSKVYGNSAACFPDLSVAYAVYAKTALVKEDYSNALKYAQLARKEYPLMPVADYKNGFAAPTSEWIWGSFNDATETLYYWSYQVTMAYNGYYANPSLYGGVVANRELIDATPKKDIRKGLFLYKETFCDEGQQMDNLINKSGYGEFAYKSESDPGYKAMQKASQYARDNCSYTPYEQQTYPYASLKFACTGLPGTGCVPYIRSSEMVLIEAEANYFLKKETEAQAALVELNKNTGRNPEYACTKSGEELLKEIIFYRRLELWGEGRNWFDNKRWKRTFTRKGLEQGGNFHAAIAGKLGDKPNFYKWIIPAKETDYNTELEIPKPNK